MDDNISSLILKVLNVLVDNYLFDVEKFSQPWMYYLVFIPVTVYLIFFIAKWIVLTFPLWITFALVFAFGSPSEKRSQSEPTKSNVIGTATKRENNSSERLD